ncbi:hypothetical protein FQA47_023360 [Oryzias melastigma]|uniref:Uncharacterized protein n=1 Tax=Oryzias melastigma TaxID=30732 RepID=A0A834CE32_ORYME|nr:hypothetical protein FQA47_023360 [Oryzias melastigma]
MGCLLLPKQVQSGAAGLPARLPQRESMNEIIFLHHFGGGAAPSGVTLHSRQHRFLFPPPVSVKNHPDQEFSQTLRVSFPWRKQVIQLADREMKEKISREVMEAVYTGCIENSFSILVRGNGVQPFLEQFSRCPSGRVEEQLTVREEGRSHDPAGLTKHKYSADEPAGQRNRLWVRFKQRGSEVEPGFSEERSRKRT